MTEALKEDFYEDATPPLVLVPDLPPGAVRFGQKPIGTVAILGAEETIFDSSEPESPAELERARQLGEAAGRYLRETSRPRRRHFIQASGYNYYQ